MMIHLTKAEVSNIWHVGQNWPAKQANVAHSVGLDNMTGNGGMDLNFQFINFLTNKAVACGL